MITMNKAESWAGGIDAGNTAHPLIVEGDQITGNTCGGEYGLGGGGIRTSGIQMSGGIVAGNVSDKTEGGGIRVDGGKSEITGGYITNNKTCTTEHWGGGGLFVSQGSTAKIQNLLVTGNTAQGLGGGVAGCSTGEVAIAANDGMACFDNTAVQDTDHGSGDSSGKRQDQAALHNEDFLRYGSNDYFCANSSYVSDIMLGGGSAKWYGSQNNGDYQGSGANTTIEVQMLAIPEGGSAAASHLMGLSAFPSEEDQAKARTAAKVFITGNESDTHGGGIMCNGVLFIGTISDTDETFSSVPVEAEKVCEVNSGSAYPMSDGEFTFALVKEADFSIDNGKPAYNLGTAQTAVNDKNGRVLFTINDLKEKGKYTYYMVEVPGTASYVTYDPAIYKVVVDVTTSETISWEIDTKLTTTVYSGEVESITKMAIEDGELVEKPEGEAAGETEALFTNRINRNPDMLIISGTKSLTGREFRDGDQFTFLLTACPEPDKFKEEGTEMPDNPLEGASKKAVVTSESGGAFQFDPITFTEEGEYHFIIREKRPAGEDPVPGVTYDLALYHVTVQVTKVSEQLRAEIVELWKRGPGDDWTTQGIDAIAFQNTYNTAEVDRYFRVQKVLEGGTLEVGQFRFVLEARGSRAYQAGENSTAWTADARQPMPAETVIANGSAGFAAFGAIAYTPEHAGSTENGMEYRYAIREQQPTLDGTMDGDPLDGAVKNEDGRWVYQNVVYDNSEKFFTIHVYLENQDGQGEDGQTVSNGTIVRAVVLGEETERDGTFTNTAITDNPPPPPYIPDDGDDDDDDDTNRTEDNPPPPALPEETIPENPTPLTELPDPNEPDSPDVVTIIEDEVPTTYVKVQAPETEEFMYIPEEDVPLYGFEIPETGDNGQTVLWAALSAASLTGIAVLTVTRKKEEEDD